MESASEEARKAIAAYPEAEQGQQRWIIWLTPRAERAEEAGLLLQIRVGMDVETDGVNRYGLVGQLSNRSVSGWGYNYYLYEGQPIVTSTRMGSMGFGVEDTTVWTVPTVIPYNSRLPVVVYTPEQMQVSHREFKVVSDYGSASIG